MTPSERATAILNLFHAGTRQGTSIGDLLAQSKAAHLQYRRAVLHAEGKKDDPAAAIALRTAAITRAQATLADPTYTDAAWDGNASPHEAATISHLEVNDDLLLFYQQKLGV